jgi:DNA-binding protein HU-beta
VGANATHGLNVANQLGRFKASSQLTLGLGGLMYSSHNGRSTTRRSRSAVDAFTWINVRIVENAWFTRPVPLWLGTANQRVVTMATQMTKSQLIEQIATKNELGKKDVKGVMETLAMIGYKELKKNGVFVVPGFAKFVVIKKPATKARNGTNPFTGEPTIFKAKPARKIVRARPVKAAKDAV